MKTEREPKLTPQMRTAVSELESLVRQHYPEASFVTRRSPDDERSVDLVTTVDLDDPDVVMDLVVDRVMELQIEHELPIHVVPVRTVARRARLLAERQQAPAYEPVDLALPQA